MNDAFSRSEKIQSAVTLTHLHNVNFRSTAVRIVGPVLYVLKRPLHSPLAESDFEVLTHDYITLVQCGGKNANLILVQFMSFKWAGQLSTRRRIFFFSFRILLSKS